MCEKNLLPKFIEITINVEISFGGKCDA